MSTVTTIRPTSDLPAGEAKIARVSVRTWVTSPVGAASASDSGPETLEERSVTAPGTSPHVDGPGYQSSEGGAENLGGNRLQAHGIAVDARRYAVDPHLGERRRERRLQDEPTVDARAQVELDRACVDPPQRVAERTVDRGHRSDLNTVALDPGGGEPPRQYQRAVGLELVSEQTSNGEHVFGGNPRVREIAQVRGRLAVAPGDLRPLIPRERAPVRQKEAQELERRVPASQPDHGADDADLVGRVILRRSFGRALRAPIGEIGVEGTLDGGSIESFRYVQQIDCVRGGRGIEIRPFGAPGNEVEVARGAGRGDRGEQSCAPRAARFFQRRAGSSPPPRPRREFERARRHHRGREASRNRPSRNEPAVRDSPRG